VIRMPARAEATSLPGRDGHLARSLLLVVLLAGCGPPVMKTQAPTASHEQLDIRRQLATIVQSGTLVQQRSRFDGLIQSIGSTFEEVPVTLPDEPLKWAKVTLNSANSNFDAVRFRSPLDVPADMRWLFVLGAGQKINWFIVPASGHMAPGFETWVIEKNLSFDFDRSVIPLENKTILQPLDGGQIQARQEYFLWFLQPHLGPMEVQLAIRLGPSGSFPKSTSANELARDLGLRTPLRHNEVLSLEQLEKQLQDRLHARDLDGALRVTEQYLEKAPVDREMLFWAASLNISRGERARTQAEPEDPRPYFFAAVKFMRERKKIPLDLTADEQSGLAEALYFEAEAFALEGDPSKTLASLKESLAAGYDAEQVDVSRFKSLIADNELASLLAK
jgi:hypothetical protein